jgi:hypothetical protein
MGQNWPPEIDVIEGGQAHIHWGQGNTNQQAFPYSIDETQWHLWECQWTSSTITLSCDGVVYGTMANPSPTTDAYGLQYPMFVSLQIQTGDPTNPATSTTITAANPIQMQVDWIQVCVPTVSINSDGSLAYSPIRSTEI